MPKLIYLDLIKRFKWWKSGFYFLVVVQIIMIFMFGIVATNTYIYHTYFDGSVGQNFGDELVSRRFSSAFAVFMQIQAYVVCLLPFATLSLVIFRGYSIRTSIFIYSFLCIIFAASISVFLYLATDKGRCNSKDHPYNPCNDILYCCNKDILEKVENKVFCKRSQPCSPISAFEVLKEDENFKWTFWLSLVQVFLGFVSVLYMGWAFCAPIMYRKEKTFNTTT